VKETTLQNCRLFIQNHMGKRLLLSATPASSDAPSSLLRTLNLIPRRRGAYGGGAGLARRATRNVALNWFERVNSVNKGKGWTWTLGSREEFVSDWVRSVVSHASLRFDQSVFPYVDAYCENDRNKTKRCVVEYDLAKGTVSELRESELPLLTEEEHLAISQRDYQNLVPMVVRVPMRSFVGTKASSNDPTSKLLCAGRKQPYLLGCVLDEAPESGSSVDCLFKINTYSNKQTNKQFFSGKSSLFIAR
jgi:hypothetical protein